MMENSAIENKTERLWLGAPLICGLPEELLVSILEYASQISSLYSRRYRYCKPHYDPVLKDVNRLSCPIAHQSTHLEDKYRNEDFAPPSEVWLLYTARSKLSHR